MHRELPDVAVAALANGRKIEAVKLVRREWGVGLKEAKDAVDQYLSAQYPSVDTRRAPTVESGTGRLLWLIIVVAAALGAYYLWTLN